MAHDWEAAIAAFDLALSLNGNSSEAWRLSGWGRVMAGDPHSGAEHLSRAIQLSPRDPNITYALTGLGVANMRHCHIKQVEVDSVASSERLSYWNQ